MNPKDIILSVCLLLGAFIVTYLVMPRIIGVVTYKRLMDAPNDRSSHSKKTPSLGGIAFFLAFSLGIYFLQPWDHNNLGMTLLPGLLILFIVGLKDDLVVLSPTTKILAQIAAITFLLVHPGFQIHQINSYFGIGEVSVFLTFPLAAFVGLFIINAFNLIDGIDGLAAMIAIVIFGVYGLLFFLLDLFFFMGISLIAIGTLLAFLRFNLSSKKKIFMGDTGSLILGFLIAAGTIRLFSVDHFIMKKLPFQLENLPMVVVAILIVPVFDTTRVFTVRLLSRKKPFTADRNHIHHLMIDYLKISHRRASFFIMVANTLFLGMFLFLGANLDNVLLFVLLLVCIVIFVYFFFRINFSYKNLRRRVGIRIKVKKLKQNTHFAIQFFPLTLVFPIRRLSARGMDINAIINNIFFINC